MKECSMIKGSNSISVCLFCENKRILDIGQKMEEIAPEAYMNGYNWAAFLRYYLSVSAPDLLDGLDEDPEAGMCCMYYPLTAENEKKAERLQQMICDLVEDEERIYRLLRGHGGEIEWD